MTELEAFAGHWRLLGHSDHGLECALGVLRRFESMLGKTFAEATPLDLRSYLALRSLRVAPGTLAVDVRSLKTFYAWRAEMLDCEDPARTLKLPRIPEPVTESVSVETYTRLLAAIPTQGRANRRDRAILAVLWGSGARLSEVARMRAEDLDLSAGTFVIPKAKAQRPRVVGLTPEGVRAIVAYLKMPRGDRSPTLWYGTKGELTSEGIKQMIQRRARAAGVKVSAHMFRRGVAERWLAAGGSETLLRYHAGWESPLMVKRYVRKNGERLAVEEHRRLLG